MDIFYTFKAIFISGLFLGSLYAIIASGLSLIWGTFRMYNFSHGSMIILSAYIALQAISVGGFLFGVITAIIISFFLGIIMEKIIIEPFLDKPEAQLIVLITTLAAMLLIDNSIQIIWGARLKKLPMLLEGRLDFVGVGISFQQLIIISIVPIILILFSIFLKRSRIGLAIRAVEQNLDLSLLVGINVRNTYAITFGISAILAAIAGVLLGSNYLISPSLGAGYLLKAFIVIIIGGLGSLTGTLLAAYMIGIIEAAGQFFLGLYWTPFLLFTILIVVLTFKPTGFFGEKGA